MGDPKFSKKKYNTPKHPWKENRIESERELIKKYGLKNHKEVWKAKTYLGRYRQQARELLARIGTKTPQVTKESEQLLLHLTRMGILASGSTLDDVLALETESILSRRLQTLVYLKGFSNTVSHSRQLINHGHIEIEGRKVTIPGYIVTKDEESEIGYTIKSPLNEISHPARPKTDVYEQGGQPEKPSKDEKPKPEPEKKEEIKEEQVKKEEKIEKPEEKSEVKEKNKDSSEEKQVKKPETDEIKKEEEKPNQSEIIEEKKPIESEKKKDEKPEGEK